MTEQLKNPLQALEDTVSKRGNENAMIQPLGGGNTRSYTWLEVKDEALRMASYLKSLGYPKGSHIALMSKNCSEWIIADLAIWMAGHVSIPLYPTLTSTTVGQILEHSESKMLFVGKLDVWDEAKAGVPEGLPLVAFTLAPEDVREASPCWENIIEGHEPLADVNQPSPDDLATIVYTSGTTGMPKGVMQNMRSFSVVGTKLIDVYNITAEDRMISYLPLSHVAERVAVEMSMLYVGMRAYFAESLDTFAQDLQRAQPTVFFAVPRIWNKFYQKASEALPPKKFNRLIKIPILGGIVKKKIRTALGLQDCRIAITGAAPLSPELIDWYNKLDLEILDVYGMTENMAWSHATRIGDQRPGWVGTPQDQVECRISDVGEILVKSAGNMIGYYKEPEKTAEAFEDDVWLKTGDKGEIDSEGRLRITGRVKEIFKTEKGKYVAPAPIENRLVAFPGIEQACVMGTGLPQPIALLSLSEEQAEEFKTTDKDEFTKGLSELLQKVNGEIDAHERLRTLVVVKEFWTVENGLVTPTLKMKRPQLEELYKDNIEEWASQKGVIWA